MAEPGSIQPRQRVRPMIVAASAVGVLVGGWAGTVMRGSGMFFSNLILAGCLVVVLTIIGAGALAAGLTGRHTAARAAAGFVAMTVATTVVAYAVAPPYRSPDAGIDHPGRVIVHIGEPAPIEWSEAATCRTRERDTPVFRVSANHQETEERTVSVTLNLGQGSTPGRDEFWISLLALPAGITQYVVSSGTGLDVTLAGADGLTGSARFAAPREPGAYRSPDPEPVTLTGTIEWTCVPTPSS
jgi:hypothetical protein